MASFHHTRKSGKPGTAAAHSAYTSRSGRHAEREDLVYSEHGNLPAWALDIPRVFWRAADAGERRNGAAYREDEIALPNELTVEQSCVLASTIARELVGSKAYELNVHLSTSQLSGNPNRHMHLMYCDRLHDGIERPPERYFARYNPKYPEKGGCRKDSGGRNRMEVRDNMIEVRRQIADFENEALERHGFDARVDHRSLKAQGKSQKPERHLGPAKVKAMSAETKVSFTAPRA